jgi:uroporphyrinogen decarboxylase
VTAIATAAEPRSSLLVRACRGGRTERTPVWLMRQAGRYMPEYRAIRSRQTMLEAISDPATAAEITLQPVNALDVDGAIIFSDILPPLIGMGLDLDFVSGVGPRISNPIRTRDAVDRLATPPAEETLSGTLEAIRLVKAEIEPRGIPVIGFAGAPFTLACYAIEGGGSRNYEVAKEFMYREPAAWQRLMQRLVTVIADYLLAQMRAGADIVQVFDSWAGALGPDDYQRYVAPHNRALFARLAPGDVPVISFSTGAGAYFEQVAHCGGDVLGIDWRTPLDSVRETLGDRMAVMGNLDPVTLLAPWRELKAHADDVLRRAGDRRGYVFNLGHGILPPTPVDNVRRLIDHVKQSVASGND